MCGRVNIFVCVFFFAAYWNRSEPVGRPAEADRLGRASEEGAGCEAVRRGSRDDHEGEQPGADGATHRRDGAV